MGDCPVSHAVELKSAVMPSYLSDFGINYEKIRLFFAKQPSICLNDDVFEESSPKSSIEDAVTLDECDLTGNPLKVDLGSADDTVLLLENLVPPLNRWLPYNMKQLPLSELEARKILRWKMRDPNENQLPTFVICNGGDALKTVVLGCELKDFMSCKIHILNCIEKGDVVKKLNNMVKSHSRLLGCQEVTYLGKMKYNIYGRSFKTLVNQISPSLRKSDKHASVSVDVVYQKCIFNTFPIKDAILKMNLEIIVGHQLLSLHDLWTELCLLQSYIDILFKGPVSYDELDENLILCNDSMDMDVICGKMFDLVSSRVLKREVDKEVDLKHIREGNLLDGLWNLLKYCDNVYTLRECFNYFFELLLERNSRSAPIKDNRSNIVSIFNGLLSGKLVFPCITRLQSVHLLFELGALKLKNDYQAILRQFSKTVPLKIESVWSEYFLKYQKSESNTRNTRIPENGGTFRWELRVEQLAYLTQLHIASEFIYIVKGLVNLSEHSFYYLCSALEKEYVHNTETVGDFLYIFQHPLCEFAFELQSKDAAMLEEGNLWPSRWTMSMNSKLRTGVEATTVYDLSEFPIFPPIIYDDYDIPINQEGDQDTKYYYASKMVQRKGF